MSQDAIIDEVRAIRDAIAREYDYDVDGIFRMLRQREATTKEPHVTFPPRRLDTPSGPDDAAPHPSAAADGVSRRG